MSTQDNMWRGRGTGHSDMLVSIPLAEIQLTQPGSSCNKRCQ